MELLLLLLMGPLAEALHRMPTDLDLHHASLLGALPRAHPTSHYINWFLR